MNTTYLLFDLDGTITDSMPGITNSFAYALQHMGISGEDKNSLRKCVGPPLRDSFMEYYGFSEEEAVEGIRLYREYYAEKGIFENSVYTGIPQLLKACREDGKKIILATSKPQHYAEQILDYFDLTKYFDDVRGSVMENAKYTKADVIRCALERNGIKNPDDAVMIGDRKHDVLGAKECGLSCIGVLFGYGDREELEVSGAPCIVRTVEELQELLLQS